LLDKTNKGTITSRSEDSINHWSALQPRLVQMAGQLALGPLALSAAGGFLLVQRFLSSFRIRQAISTWSILGRTKLCATGY